MLLSTVWAAFIISTSAGRVYDYHFGVTELRTNKYAPGPVSEWVVTTIPKISDPPTYEDARRLATWLRDNPKTNPQWGMVADQLYRVDRYLSDPTAQFFAALFLPPAVLLALGAGLGWVISGFRTPKNVTRPSR